MSPSLVSQRRVLVVRSSLAPGGGSLVAAWMVEALRADYRVTLLTWESPDLAAVDRLCGTSLADGGFDLALAGAAARWLARHQPTPMILLRHHWLMREARRRAGEHDVVIGVDNEGDLGGRGIQYVHYPMLGPVKPDPGHAWYGRLPLTLRTYHAVAARVTGYRAARMRTNLTLVNSDFIGAQVRALHGVETVTLYPPVPGDFRVVPWEARRNSFMAIGRLTPEKRIGTMIAMIAAVRATHPDVELHLVGATDDSAYARRVRRLVRDHDGWVFLHEDVDRAELVRLVVQHRWGIHAMPDEHFGIAVAEMVRGGCVVFVPNGSGPAEIVGDAPALCFGSEDDAVRKIRTVLEDAELSDRLRTHLAARQAHFTTERFVDRLREIVRHHLGPP